ncbi:MAG TPA: hypothetical protein PKB02_03695 [Anaerohalosphaeraceae bacterium]|nr:hypothetical protein [Anaerohalosphaeraceae bacterium]
MKSLCFEFCDSCGSYLAADVGQVVQVDGAPMVLCPDCIHRGNDSRNKIADEFARKYQL